MIQFSIFGIPVSIQPFFWVTMALIGSMNLPDTPEELLKLALFVIAGFISILVHELGHALTLKAYRVPTAITLEAFGGYAAYPAGRLNRKQSFLVTAAGPAIQIVLGAAAYLVLANVPAVQENSNVWHFISTMMLISVFWALLNLVPVLPLDGGQLVNAVMGPARIKTTLYISVIAGVLGAVLVFYFFRSFIFPIILGMYAYRAFQALKETR